MSANGRLTEGELTAVGGILLSNSTARAWQAMVDAAQAEAGISLTIARPAGGYRSFFVQGDMKRNPGAYGLNPASSVSLAAPGNSTHGFGTRVDIGSFSGARAAWVLANCDRFGFTREFGAADPNHFKHNGVTIGGVINTSGTKTKPVQPPTVQEDDMAYIAPILEEKNGKIVATGDGYSGPNGFYFIGSAEDKKLLERDIEATRQSGRGEPVKAQFLEAERIIVDGYKSGTRKR
jgi:hypothetical protein